MRKVNKKLLFNKSIRQTLGSLRLTAQPVHTAGAVASDTPIVSRVSVIIPTKNAGEEFDYILRKIAQQELVNDIELVIIDSGSDDRTLEICRAYTRNIVEIPPAEFHHARTRNLGVERATGEFLVFTVQDAVPIGNYWLYKLLYPIQEGQASAVSTLQIPRSDADLFATWSYWSHNLVFLGQDRDRLYNHSLFRNFDDLDMDLKRRMASLDNVCLGIRKSVFVDYKFTAEYAEDLELGMRLIKDGHSLIFQASNAVIHSHSRSALYFLKRSYIDTASILDLFSVSRGGLRTELALKASSYVYARLKMSISVLSADKGSVMYSAEGLRTLADTLCNNIDIFRPEWSLIPGNPMLDDYFESFEPTLHSDAVSSQCDYIGVLLKNFSVVSCNCVKDGDMEVDFLESIYKMFSLAAGTYIGTHTSTEIESLRGEI